MPHLTLELPEDVGTRLQARAALRGETVETFVTALVLERLEDEASALDPVAIAAIAEGISDGEAGREQTFEEYTAEMRARRSKVPV